MTTPTDAPGTNGADADIALYVPESSPPPPSPLLRLASASDVFAALASIRRKNREHLVAFHLNVRHRVLRRRTVHIGTLTGVECHPREIFRDAIVAPDAALFERPARILLDVLALD